MADLEKDVAPVLTPLVQGGGAQLTAVEQLVVATWAVKTMVMLLLAVQNDLEELGPEALSWLYRYRSPLPAERVWLARYEGEGQWPATFHYHAVGLAPPGEPWEERPNSHHASIAVGHLALGLAGTTRTEPLSVVPDLPADTVLQIWPAFGHVVSYPPAGSLAGDSEMRSLATPGAWRPT